MTITLPDELKDELERKAAAAGFASVADYLLSLAEEDEPDDAAAPGGPPELTPKNRAELEAMLEAGMNSGPPIRVTPEFWEDRRRALEERMRKRREQAP